MGRPTASGIFLIAAGVLIALWPMFGDIFLIAAGVGLVLAGILSARR